MPAVRRDGLFFIVGTFVKQYPVFDNTLSERKPRTPHLCSIHCSCVSLPLCTGVRPIIIEAVFSEVSEIVRTGVYLMILECLRAPRLFHRAALRSASL